MSEAVVVEAVRTPIGRFGGALASVRPDDLAAGVLAAAVERGGIGFTEEHDIGLFYKRALGAAPMFGGREDELERIATGLGV